jgi:hypothetical protein
MQFRKGPPELTVLDAVDNLSSMAELDLVQEIDKIPAGVLTEEQATLRAHILSWRDPEYKTFNQERIKETFIAILKYLRALYETKKSSLSKQEVKQGVRAMMLLSQEAASSVDRQTQIFKGEKVKSALELREFKELHHFYSTKIAPRLQPLADMQEIWQLSWEKEGAFRQEKGVLEDLEGVRKDKVYELFLIRKEDGTPYFSRSLLHRMQLVGQLDQLFIDPSMEDPFLHIQMVEDQEAHGAAKEILKSSAAYVDEFFKDALKFKNVEFVASLTKALMALMLAADSRNLIHNAVGKHVLDYYSDFHLYLRRALSSAEYQKLKSDASVSSERFLSLALKLSSNLCTAFFMRVGSYRAIVELIHALIEKGSKGSITQSQISSPLMLWNNLRDKDESLRFLFRQYPNRPLLKMIQLLSKQKNVLGFDPLKQQNQPAQLYVISSGDLHLSCIRLPCPTSQFQIDKALIVSEFTGFLTALKSQQCHLLINLQDRTSWKEHARCTSLEKASDSSGALVVATFPKHTDFYHQRGTYLDWDDAAEFIKQLKEQVASGEECGYFFPKDTNKKQLLAFVDKAAQTIHTLFFGKKARLVQKNRLDFIEIFYLLLTLKLIEEFNPGSISFTCKDAIDTGAAASATMYAFLRIMSDPAPLSKAESDFLLWMLYSPAIIQRERAIEPEPFERMVSALGLIQGELEANRKKIQEACSKLYNLPFFKAVVKIA